MTVFSFEALIFERSVSCIAQPPAISFPKFFLGLYFPRESTQAAQIGGVLTNFRMPDVVAVGIGGGTIIRFSNGQCSLGPDSVGYQLKEKAIAFGGNIFTLSDLFLAEGKLNIES